MAETLMLVALGFIALAAVMYPVVVGRDRFDSREELDAALERYRTATSAGTICRRCRFPNPEGSRFCAECGTPVEE
ncbi:MAG TPA: zinc ribbon domain-containing protein [Longimicrobiales bacterium]|nr:zinc ribbon domain-containing protein [Longimicrobiales bacterium]